MGKLCKKTTTNMTNSVRQVVSFVFFPYALAASGSEQVGNGSQPQVRTLGQKHFGGLLKRKGNCTMCKRVWESIGLEWLLYPYSVMKHKDQGQRKAGQQQSQRKTCFSDFQNQETRNALKGIDRSIQNWYTQESKCFRGL